MDKLQKLARARYNGGSEETRKMVHNLFNEIDKDGDGEISLDEFINFLREEGDNEGVVANESFFHSLDKDENGSLNFWEALTMFYIFESGRPWCDSCKTFMLDVYFSCVECFDMGSPSFDICLDCYTTFNWDHDHNSPQNFLDNYALLQRVRDGKNQDTYFEGEGEESEKESAEELEEKEGEEEEIK